MLAGTQLQQEQENKTPARTDSRVLLGCADSNDGHGTKWVCLSFGKLLFASWN